MEEILSLRDHVYNNITRMIQRGELKPDEKLTEAYVCEKLSISRTPAREALIQLAADGVLEHAPRKGFIVKPVDDMQQRNTYQMTSVLDGFAATLACEHLTAEDFSFMHELIEKMDISIKYRNYNEYYELQERFHDIYVSKCGNEILIASLKKLKNGTVRSTYYGEDKEALFSILAENNQEHKRIADLLEAGDTEGVEKELRLNHWADKLHQWKTE